MVGALKLGQSDCEDLMARLLQEKTLIAGFEDPKGSFGPGDIVVVGAGLAGLFTALKLAPLPVTVISPAPLGEGDHQRC